MFRLLLLSIVGVCVLIACIDWGTDKGYCEKTTDGYQVVVNGQSFMRYKWQCQDGSSFYRFDRGDIYNIRHHIDELMKTKK